MVTDRAGAYAGEWTVLGMSRVRRRAIRALPARLRARLALNVARDLVRSTYAGSRALVRRRRTEAAIDIRSSIFCGVREPVGQPLCGFYAAAVQRILTMLGVGATVSVTACRGAGHAACRLRVTLGAQAPASAGAGRRARANVGLEHVWMPPAPALGPLWPWRRCSAPPRSPGRLPGPRPPRPLACWSCRSTRAAFPGLVAR
jgi:hypothetical protein